MRFLTTLASALIIVGSFSLIPNAKADTYVPKGEKERMSNQTSNFRCVSCANHLPHFMLLAPEDHIAWTKAEEPRFFFWFHEVTPIPFKMVLIDPDRSASPSTLWEDEFVIEGKGLWEGKIPKDVKLIDDKTYVLAAGFQCGSSPPRAIRIAFKKVADDKSDSTKSLAERGLWYDALAERFDLFQIGFDSLLEQIGIELPTDTENVAQLDREKQKANC